MHVENNKPFLLKVIKIIFICIFLFLVFVFIFNNVNIENNLERSSGTIFVANTAIDVDIADEDNERILGLSGKSSLDADKGLLFIFDRPDKHGIWMKDMNFSIDILWFNENGEVIYIERDVNPNTYPKVFYPTSQSLYVLEVNAGFVERNGLALGDTIDLSR